MPDSEKLRYERKGIKMKQKLFTRNFIFLIAGQTSSLIGNYTLKFALSMYVLESNGSASVFAGLLSLSMLPTILLSPFGGILADRANRRNIMAALDALSGLSVFLASFAMAEGRDIIVIGALLVILSVLGAFESPTVQACIPQMLSGSNIVKGNAIVNQVSSIASLITPFLGSVFYAAFGIRPVCGLFLLVQDLKNPLGTCHSGLKIIVDIGDIHKRPGKLSGV